MVRDEASREILFARIERLSHQWRLREMHAFANLSVHSVYEGFCGDQEVVLKLAGPLGDLSLEVAWLRAHAGIAAEVLAWDSDEGALLLSRCRSGETLKTWRETHGEEAAWTVLCEVIRELGVRATPAPPTARALSVLGREFSVLEGFVDSRVLASARELFERLTSESPQDVFLHGDLHHENVVRDGHGWKVIDPHGWRGPVLSEVGTMIYNPLGDWLAEPPPGLLDARIARAALALKAPEDEIRAWCLCKALIAAAWSLADGEDPARALAVARGLKMCPPFRE